MKTKLLFLITILYFSNIHAQCTDNVYIPDARFKAILIDNSDINSNNDDQISCAEAAAFNDQIIVYNEGVSDLTGIEAFVNLQTLYCSYNDISSLDISSNTELINLYCSGNDITTLDMSNNANLQVLYCDANQLTTLDLTSNRELSILYAKNNQLASLDVSGSSQLTALNCDNNDLTTLNLVNNTILEAFNSTGNAALSCVEVSDEGILGYNNENWFFDEDTRLSRDCSGTIECYVTIPDANFKNALINNADINTNGDNEISCDEAAVYTGTLDVSYNSISDLTGIEAFVNINGLLCSSNELTSLDLSSNIFLEGVSCSYNDLTSINVTNNLKLSSIYCSNNLLSSLDISNNVALENLSCSTNVLTSLNVSNNPALVTLSCGTNNLETLDVSTNIFLKNINVAYNQLTNLNLANNNNTIIESFSAIQNPGLSCVQVDDVAYSQENWYYSIDNATVSYQGKFPLCNQSAQWKVRLTGERHDSSCPFLTLPNCSQRN